MKKTFRVLPISIRLETAGGITLPFIKKGTLLPVSRTRTFMKSTNNPMEACDINVYIGESPIKERNKVIGEFNIIGSPLFEKEGLKFEAIFDVSPNLEVQVKVKEAPNHIEAIYYKNDFEISEKDIDYLIQEAKTYSEQDEKYYNLVMAKNEAEILVEKAESMLGESLSQKNMDDIENAIANLGTVLESDDVDKITEKTKLLRGIMGFIEMGINDILDPLSYRLRNLRKTIKESKQIISEVNAEQATSVEEIGTMNQERSVFVVHGRNLSLKDGIFSFLRSLDLHPIEWVEAVSATGKPSPYVGEILDAAFSMAQAVLVLLTPDDQAILREEYREENDPQYECQLTPQARPNVIFEAGMSMGKFPERTILVQLGDLRPFSDIGGIHVLRLNNSTQKRQELANRLQVAGCPVNLKGIGWHTEGNLDIVN